MWFARNIESGHTYKTNKSIDQLLKETEKEAPKTAPKPAQKSADSSDDDFVSDDDEGMIYTIITDCRPNLKAQPQPYDYPYHTVWTIPVLHPTLVEK